MTAYPPSPRRRNGVVRAGGVGVTIQKSWGDRRPGRTLFLVGRGQETRAQCCDDRTRRLGLGKRIIFGRLEARCHLVSDRDGGGADRRFLAGSVSQRAGRRGRGGVRRAGGAARADGHARLPADPGRSSRRRGCRTGHVSGAGAAGALDPAEGFGRKLALRGRRAGRGPGAT